MDSRELHARAEAIRDRFGALALGTLPTSVLRLDALSRSTGAEVFVKRDDLTGALYGGNKVRKLELILADAERRGARHIVTAGAVGSHHVLATALYGRARGLAVTALLVPQPPSAHVAQNLRAALATGADLRFVPAAALPLAAAAAVARIRFREGRAPYLVPLGGSSAIGAMGYVLAGLELADQIARGEAPVPDAVFVALGTGGTAVGLALGIELAGLGIAVHAVRVVGTLTLRLARVEALEAGVRRALGAIGAIGQPPPARPLNWVTVHDQIGRGYGHATAAAERAIRIAHAEADLTLEATYTGKTFAALLRHADGAGKGKRLLYWHTLSAVSPPPASDEELARAPAKLRPYLQGS